MDRDQPDHCPSCTETVPAGSRFCASCGTDLRDHDPEVTRTRFEVRADLAGLPNDPHASGRGAASGAGGDPSTVTTPSAGPRRTPTPTPRPALPESRFLPGAMVAGRYRIFGLLGLGGMGEVYRADDLKLGQPVALKFLPEHLADDEDRLNRFLNEVRTARQVAHPNVCRVYDVGEVEGHHYLTMEYVDGEDLASLLRRIGRLPADKAVQIARQLCAGLGAAHDQGVLHRDLKPANVMIDGRGGVRITDFGLAALAETVVGDAAREGTPSYMAPEQIAGESASVRSDIYALGLVLYELFTGQRAFKARTAAEMSRLQQDSSITSPSTLVDGLDPAVERTIVRCLEREPADRPPSALGVAASLPGGDPLAAALAAGETPSPELVAAAGSADAMNPVHALGIAALAVVLFFVAAWLNGRNALRAFVPTDKPPAAMVDRARDIIAELGYSDPVYADPADSAFGYSVWVPKLDRIETEDPSPDRWERIRSPEAGIVGFWYRQSPVLMLPESSGDTFAGGPVDRWNPWPSTTGGIMVSLDPAGRLRFFVHTPRRYRTEPVPEEPFDWSRAFDLADLDMSAFERVEPRYQRYMTLDQRAAWVGELPGQPGDEVRIELGTSDGRLSLFAIVDRWELESLAGQPGNLSGASPQRVTFLGLILVFMVAAAALARHNWKLGRADRRGATRLMTFMFLVTVVQEVLRAHGLIGIGFPQIFPILGKACFYVAVIVVFYLALEPYARRTWPAMLVSWSRLVGRSMIGWRDALVGRSVLAGVTGGTVICFLWPLAHWAHSLIQGAPARPNTGLWLPLLGPRFALSHMADALRDGITEAAVLTFVLVLARMLTRRTLPSVVVAIVVSILMSGFSIVRLPHAVVQIGASAAVAAVLITLLLRFGLVAAMLAIAVSKLNTMAWSVDFSAWHARPGLLAAGLMVALCLYGYRAASAGRRLLGEETPSAVAARS